ncbi:MAG: flagellar assembly factor FliW [Epulopiscium sp.]|jgi:flagellar assembly factor FliW|uniref:Flagellar assembly factor FliW n=1 Tax=Defluviitalea raffinosedens TaxID=1450156 RepID=A0A7C8LFK3_9FIRM|nr:flagellar assembly protein FliW [Defluviitalea raffinosedens]KAE9635603.1 flagellar assembly protein FliW [Defluviitalea raffinosedens]MBM7684520.1 flagellar assembly factor FliW [Defluviitalea raffinosedens]MDK2786847.1 flagellar assembly factor FliW [Candidatus Epulonipiscium sp.]HHW68376.1 flagellar assembly protein FliW [Candidatus Epulonipiscium sp.]
MILQTKHFGELNIDEGKVITFPEGIPGFPDHKRYVFIFDEEDENSPFCWLQSVDDGDIAFALVNPLKIYSDYSPEVDNEHTEALGEFSESDLIVYAIVVVPEDITQMTANLKAPIIINIKTKIGMQVIAQNEEYEVKHKIFNDLQEYASAKEGV